MRAQASPSSPLPSTLACLTTFRSLGVEEQPASPCSRSACGSWKALVLLATRAALLRATTDWRDFRAGQGPLRTRRPPLAFASSGKGCGESSSEDSFEEKTWQGDKEEESLELSGQGQIVN